MIKIRLARFGKKNDPFYRIVATDHQNKLTGKSQAVVGYWHPKSKLVNVNKEEIAAWVKKGAQVTPAVEKLLQ